MKTCDACGAEIHEEDKPLAGRPLSTGCEGCGFSWEEIAQAVKLVDAVGAALGVDTGVLNETHFQGAVMAVLTSPFAPQPDVDIDGEKPWVG